MELRRRFLIATLKNRHSGDVIQLHAPHVFGRRERGVNTVLLERFISRTHCTIAWSNDGWRIQDHSRNGTWVDGHRLEKGRWQKLSQFATICIGKPTANIWKVVDLSAPYTCLVPLTKNLPTIKLSRFQALPSESKVELSLYYSNHQQWVMEQGSSVRTLLDGDTVKFAGTMWKFLASESEPETESQDSALLNLDQLRLSFKEGNDDQHVYMTVHEQDDKVNLGARAHHRLLYALAQLRISDRDKGIDTASQGWVGQELLCNMLRIEADQLQSMVYLARKQIFECFSHIPHCYQIIERRNGSLRIAILNVHIQKDETIDDAVVA